MLHMLTWRTETDRVSHGENPVIQEAVTVLNLYQAHRTIAQHWVCEVCGMIHTGSVPDACESCGSTTAIVQLQDLRREINSRW